MFKILLSLVILLAISLPSYAERGLVFVESQFSVSETADRLASIISKKGLTLFARINHQANASNANLDMLPTEILIFGNPKVGTPLMNCNPTVAIDLPQKVLISQDKHGNAWMAYNDPSYLKQRHLIEGCDKILDKISKVLAGITKVASLKD